MTPRPAVLLEVAQSSNSLITGGSLLSIKQSSGSSSVFGRIGGVGASFQWYNKKSGKKTGIRRKADKGRKMSIDKWTRSKGGFAVRNKKGITFSLAIRF